MSTNIHDDPVMFEIPVYIGNLDNDPKSLLYLLQYTHNTSFQSIPSNFSTIQFKPQTCQLSLTIPFDINSPNYSREKAIELNRISTEGNAFPLDSYILSGENLPQQVTYYAARKESSGLVMFPLTGIIQLGPAFHYLDVKPDLSNQRDITPDMKAIQLQFRKKETAEELDARLNSYSYQLKRMNDEPWQTLSYDSLSANQEYKAMLNNLLSSSIHSIHHPSSIISPDEYLGVYGINKQPIIPTAIYHELHNKSLLEQIRSILSSIRIISFRRLFELIQIDKTEQLIIEYLSMIAWLIYGDIWIIKSDIFNQNPKIIHSRNLLIHLFKTKMNQDEEHYFITKQEFVNYSKISYELADILLREIASLVYGKGWKLKVNKISFHSQELTLEQSKLFERELQRSLILMESSQPSRPLTKMTIKKDQVSEDDLGLAILNIMKEYHILDFQSICHLVKKKIETSDEKVLTKLKQHSYLIELPQVWTLRTVEDEQTDKYRTIILSMFITNTTLKKSDIVQKIREILYNDIPNNIYNKIMKELAISSGSQWILKTGHLNFVHE